MRTRWIFALLTLAIAVVAAADELDQQLDGREQQLQSLRREIAVARERADVLASDEKQQLARINALERERELTEELLGRLANKELGIRVQTDSLQVQLESARGRVERRRVRLGERLRAMYMRPRHSVIVAALTAESMSELSTRVRTLTHVARTEKALIRDVQGAQADLRAHRGELAGQMAEINLTRSETEDRKAQLARLQSERNDALLELRQERAAYEATLAEKESAAAAMESLIADLERRRQERSEQQDSPQEFGGLQGGLPWPVEGRLLKPYGRSVHPEFKTVVVNKGVNIGAASGTPIRSVANGMVEYVDWLPGYGKCIIVDHGQGYYSLYAHASAIFPAEGSIVQQGEVLGEVGDTGSLNGSQLYFEIRQGKDSLDPSAWLRSR